MAGSPEDIPPEQREPWRRRLIRTLLYGKNVDRAAKARARVGLAILGFAIVYAVIAGKLVVFAVAPDSPIARRSSGQDAVATARPDILDRNGQILATDVRMSSLFAEPRRLIDVDEAVGQLLAQEALHYVQVRRRGVGVLEQHQRRAGVRRRQHGR